MTSNRGISQEELEAGLNRYYREIGNQAEGLSKAGDLELFARSRQPRSWRRWTQGLVALAATIAILAAVVAPRLASSPAVPGGLSAVSNAPMGGKIEPDPSLGKAGISRSGQFWVTYKQKLLLSSDGGQSWPTIHPLIPDDRYGDTVSDAYVLDSDHFWTVSAAGVADTTATVTVTGTADGGSTWVETTPPVQCGARSIALSFVDANRGFMVCQQGNAIAGSPGQSLVFETRDGGTSWTRQGACGTSGMLMTASDETTLWLAGRPSVAAGTDPLVFVSHDEGRTCTRVDLPGIGGLPSASILSVALAPVFSDREHGSIVVAVETAMEQPAIWFYRTSDGGGAWTRVTHPTGFISDSLMNSAYGNRLVTVSVRHMAVSDDNGQTWTEFDPTGLPSDKPLSWLAFSSSSTGVALVLEDTDGLVLYSTADGGRSWVKVDLASASLPS
jgi:photosystem II stability/assembly factor-like uncharacterized protein